MNKTTWETLPDALTGMVFPEFLNTVYMVAWTAVFSLLFGTLMAVLLILTEKKELALNKPINLVLDFSVNLIMAFPYIILAVYIIPFTKIVAGTALGARAAVVPMTIVESAFLAKVFRDGLREVNPYVIHSAKSFGANNLQVIGIMLKETLPYFVSGFTMMLINAISCSTIAGTMGAGGLGATAVVYGYHRNDFKIVVPIAIILLIMVQILQYIGDKLYVKLK